MRRYVMIILLVLLVSCSTEKEQPPIPAVSPTADLTTPTSTAVPSATPLPPPTATALPTATATATPSPIPPTATPQPTATATSTPMSITDDFGLTADSLLVYPAPALYSGDQVSFDIFPIVPTGVNVYESTAQLLVDGVELETEPYASANFSGMPLYRFEWAWDTTDSAGEHIITVVLDPNDSVQQGDELLANNVLTTTLTVLPAEQKPWVEQGAGWVSAEGEFSRLYAIHNSAAERDLAQLVDVADAAVVAAATQLSVTLPANIKLDVYLVDRVIGQGGYTSGYLTYVISYLDRHYASNDLYQVLLHETVHVLDNVYITPDGGSGFMSEGLAVWAAGGHYKEEDVARRAAALVATDLYIPFDQLLDNFYPSQHEIGYLEAGAFIDYIMQRYGWDAVAAYLVDAGNVTGTVYEAVDAATRTHFGLSLDELEAEWLQAIAVLPPDPDVDWEADVVTTIRLFDVMRNYQTAYDYTANYLFGWLAPPNTGFERGITADFSRRPETAENIALETMMVAAQEGLVNADYALANRLLDSVDAVLEAGTFSDALAQTYLEIVQLSAENGYEAQQIHLEAESATVLAHLVAPNDQPAALLTLTGTRSANTWQLAR